MTDTTQPHPEPSEEASSLPVVAWLHKLLTESYRETSITSFSEDDPWQDALKEVGHAVISDPLVRLSDAQSQLNAMRAERDAARVLAASHSNECEKWAAMHQRSKAEISDLKTDYESRLKKLCDHGMGLCDQIDALKAALKAAQKEGE
jgi:hypothetical protein